MSELVVNQVRPAEIAREEAITPMGILQMAISQGADIDKLTKLMELQERWEANEARKAFNAAMAKFKDNPPQLSKNKHVKFHTSKGVTEYDHATLNHVTDQITASLAAVGVSHKWAIDQQGSSISVSCILTHALGHSEKTTLSSGPDDSGGKNSIQSIGSAVTYLQRYTLLAATGMAAGLDEDGRASATLPDEQFIVAMEQIEHAPNIQALQKEFASAYKMAEAAKDSVAMANFVKCKDLRKKEINAGN